MASIDATRVHEIFMDCLFCEMPQKTERCIALYTCQGRFHFIPDKISEHRQEIHDILGNLRDEFFESKGGGYSFMALPFTKDDEQWGEQTNGDQLMALGLASGYMQYLFGAEMWRALPGGVPYIIIHEEPVEIPSVTVEDALKLTSSITPIVSTNE